MGVAARALAAVLEPHFVREEAIALPPLGVLAEQLLLHAQNEKEVMYPAALLVGETVRAQIAPAASRR